MQFKEIIQTIENLLLEHNCVIIPNFGGFVMNVRDFEFDSETELIHPRSKWIAFNERLKSDDGLLAMAISKEKQLTQKKAFEIIANFSFLLKKELVANDTLIFGQIGNFTFTKDQKLLFEPNQDFNYDLEQFGLFTVSTGLKVKPVLNENPVLYSLQDQETITQVEIKKEVKDKKKISAKFYVYLLCAFLVGGAGAYILTEPNSKFVNSSFSPFTIRIKKEKVVVQPSSNHFNLKTTKIKVINNDSTKVEIKNTLSSQQIVSNIFLVAASFKTLEKAEIAVLELRLKGFEKVELLPKLVDENFYRISVGRLETMDAAYREADIIKKSKSIDIWVYKRH